MKKIKSVFVFLGLTVLVWSQNMEAQELKKIEETAPPKQEFWKDRKIFLNEEGSNYLKFAILAQVWVRDMQYNPGSTIFGEPKNNGTDIGIRRFRVQMYGQIADRVFIYSQVGQNNFNNISDRKQGFFLHDAVGEYALDKEKISLGAGLTGWAGLSRFSSSSVGSFMGMDGALFLESTNDVSDQFVRKLSVYAKGKLGKFDYRVTIAQPMAIQKTVGYVPTLGERSSFSPKPPEMQYNGYFQYQFKDQESNLMPYATGTYLGKKNVLNIGAGFIYQKDAMWQKMANDTTYSNMVHLSADIFYDAPIGTKGEAVSVYGNFTHYDFGSNYIRNTAPLNPANGSNDPTILNGGGNGFPAYGTGNVLYAQVGYKFKDNLIGKTTLMPYVAMQHAHYERLNQDMNFYDIGVNWLLAGQTSKFTVSYQNRPIYNTSGDLTGHKGAVTAQYQVSF
ncbi:hypothetical protein [Flavobacterium sp. '19STA2R22 D10 B1']|uniref:hypothetical protein n=1 Tax=Flavobacterium aerium TaxID=3037261 RepID=UPI00278BEA90|nr:hypothetical protein [Flavobacterium sp. '19STA2R22 D10 B1']